MNPHHLQLLAEMPIFEHLGQADLELIEQRLIVLEFDAEDLVFREGAPGRYICFIMSGLMEVMKDTPEGESVAIASLGPGRSLGEMSIIDGLTCSATVVAREPAMVLALTKEDFDALIDEYPSLGREIYRGISRLLSISLRKTSEDLAAARSA